MKDDIREYYKTSHDYQKGSALAMVLILISIIVTFVASTVYLSASHARANRNYIDDVEALHIADAGLNAYLSAISEGTAAALASVPLNSPIPHAGGNFSVSLLPSPTPTGATKRVQVVGTSASGSGTRTIVAEISQRSVVTEYSYLSGKDNGFRWEEGDEIHGPLHINGDIRIHGNRNRPDELAAFNGLVTVSGTRDSGGGNAENSQVFFGGYLENQPIVTFPSTESIDSLESMAFITFDGRTRIMLNSDGTFTSVNNGVRVENSAIPPNGIIYVSGTTGTASEENRPQEKFNPARGNVFVSGVLDGSLTIVAKNSIFITGRDPTIDDFAGAASTGGIRYQDTTFNPTTGEVISGGNDMLGLVARNSIWLLSTGWPIENATHFLSNVDVNPNIVIHGSLVALGSGFGREIQNSTSNNSGNVQVFGSVAIRTRHEHDDRNYTYKIFHDTRLEERSPPGFSAIAQGAPWRVDKWEEW